MPYKELGLDDFMPFGKYKGEQIEDLIYDQPNYLMWCYQEEVVSFDEATIKLMGEKKIITIDSYQKKQQIRNSK